jgi:hypothetical protein
VTKEHVVRYLSENSQDILCMKIDVHMYFKNPIAFKMFLSHACSMIITYELSGLTSLDVVSWQACKLASQQMRKHGSGEVETVVKFMSVTGSITLTLKRLFN